MIANNPPDALTAYMAAINGGVPIKENAPAATEAVKEKLQTNGILQPAQKIGNMSIKVPATLRDLTGWLIWRYEQRDGEEKPRKVPYYATGGRRRGVQGCPEDRAKLETFEAATKAAQDAKFDGVGLAMLPEWGLVALDFDNCVQGRCVDAYVETLVAGTYAEMSPSGNGVRAFMRGALGNHKSPTTPDQFGFETFHSNGFVTVTGQVLDLCELLGTDDTISDLTPDVLDLCKLRSGLSDVSAAPCSVRQGHDDLYRLAAMAAVTAETIEDLRSTIPFFSKGDAENYHLWVPQFGHALASLKETGFAAEANALWHEFSAKAGHTEAGIAIYNRDQAERKWEGIIPNKITYRSIFTWAEERGWQNLRKNSTPKTDDQYATREDHTDTGNANLIWRLTDGDLRYVPERRLWLWWDGGRWVADNHGSLAHQAALRVALYYHNKAANLMQDAVDPAHGGEGRKKIEKATEVLQKWEKHCRNKRTIDAMLAMVAKDSRFHVSTVELDCDPWLLGVDNGVVDLRTGTLRPAARDEFVTKRSPVCFDPAAKAPRWLQFIEEITAVPSAGGGFTPRNDLASYLHRALGYSLTGSVAEQKMFVCIGAGSNGKNVLLDIFQWIAGDYCQTVQPEALMATRHDADAERPSPAAASLAGARAAHCSESKEGQRLDVALVKRHTGGGYMTARLMRENTFRFEITHKLWLMTNHKPALDQLDDAMRGRLHLIPFDCRWNRPGHPERDPALPDGDKYLMTNLRAEAEGVLAWLVRGAVAYSTEGMEPPVEVASMTRDYFMDQDALGRWLQNFETCTARDGGLAGNLYTAFNSWCTEEGLGNPHPRTQTAFSLALIARGVEKFATKDGKKYGLRPILGGELVTGYGL